MLEQLQSCFSARKFYFITFVIAIVFMTSPFKTKAQRGSFVIVSGAGSTDANGRYDYSSLLGGYNIYTWFPAYNDELSYTLYYSVILQAWVIQGKLRGFPAADLYKLRAPSSVTPPTGTWEIIFGLAPTPTTTVALWTQTYYIDADGDGYSPGGALTANFPAGTLCDGCNLNNNGSDCNDNDASVHATFSGYRDADGDGFGAGPVVNFCATALPAGYVANNTDCNDNDARMHRTYNFYTDADHDGYGADYVSVCAVGSNAPPSGYLLPIYDYYGTPINLNDCDDHDPTKHALFRFYTDSDRDGYGTGNSFVYACAVNANTPPPGYSLNNTDCDDNDATKHALFPFYVDSDGDGYGVGSAINFCAVNATTPPSGYSANNTDCNDNDATKHASFPFYYDADGDGYAGTLINVCAVNATTPPSGYFLNSTDCNDNDATKHASFPFYVDSDGDGYGVGSAINLCAVNATTPPTGYSVNNTDCNDNDASIHTPPTVSVSTTSPSVCAGFPTTLSGVGATSFAWSGGVINSVSFVPTATTTYTVTGTTNGCTATATQTITVNPLPTVIVSPLNPSFCNSPTTVLNFDGVDDYVSQPFAINGNSGTWEAWVQKANWADHHDDRLFGNGIDAGVDKSFIISLHPGVGFHFRYGGTNQTGNNYVSSLITQSFVANSWHHLAAAWSWNGSQTSIVLYIDGVQVSNNISTLNLYLDAPSYVGGDPSNPKFGAGSMKDISLWSIPRTASDIASSYTSSTAHPQFGLYSLLNFNTALANGTNTNTIVDDANVGLSGLHNFTLSGGSSNYILQNVPINHFVTLTANGASTYAWSNGISNGVPFMPTATNTYSVTGTSPFGCVATVSQLVTVNQGPNIAITASAQSICIPSSTVLNFDGVDDYVSQPIAINGNSGTWEAWVQKANWADHHDDRLFGNGINTNVDNAFIISLHPGVGFHFRYGGTNQTGNNYVSSLTTQSFTPNSWHHLAAVWSWNGSQTIIVLCIDGVQVSNNISTLNLYLNAPSYIGGDPSNPKFGAGSMKDISLWSIPRTASAIATSYAGSTAYPQFGLYSLLNFNSAIANGTNANTIVDNANVGISGLYNFTLSGASSNYISSVVPIIPTPITLTASGASTYVWSSGITNGVPFGFNATNTYNVTATDANGCTNTGSQTLTVNQGNSATASLATDNQTSTVNQGSSGMTYFSNNCNNLILGLTASGSTPVNGTVESRVWIETSAPSTFVKRHYQITPTTNPNGSTGHITLYFTQTDLNDFNSLNVIKLPINGTDAAGIARFRIEKRSGISSDGTGLPTTYTSTPTIIKPNDADILWDAPLNRWEVSFDVTGFSGFFAVAQASVLPIELLDFKAKNTEGGNLLTWITESEKNNAYFNVERSSDANTFSNIGQIKGFGTTGTPQYYSLLDTSPLTGVNYYRLKQVDTNGKFAYSKTISVKLLKGSSKLKVYPNPSDITAVTIEIVSNTEGVFISNALGQVLFQSQIKTQNQWLVDISAWASGIYFVRSGEEVVKFVKN